MSTCLWGIKFTVQWLFFFVSPSSSHREPLIPKCHVQESIYTKAQKKKRNLSSNNTPPHLTVSDIMFLLGVSLMGTLIVFNRMLCMFFIMDSWGMWCPHRPHAVHITRQEIIGRFLRCPVWLYSQIPIALTGVGVANSPTLHGDVHMAPSLERLRRLPWKFWSLLCGW